MKLNAIRSIPTLKFWRRLFSLAPTRASWPFNEHSLHELGVVDGLAARPQPVPDFFPPHLQQAYQAGLAEGHLHRLAW